MIEDVCVLGVLILTPSTVLRLDFVTVLRVWYNVLFFNLFLQDNYRCVCEPLLT